MKHSKVREATKEDLPRLLQMARAFHEKKQHRYSFVGRDAETFLSQMIDGGIVLISDTGFIAGVVAGGATNAAHLTAHEVLWWSQGREGFALRRAFEDEARKAGCDDVQFSFPSGEETVGKILARAGYEPCTQVVEKVI